ncbi:MAG: RnfABCDGE type electron transport complex subunit D, partial [Firmicutes bacterium]|nr:RnfABCDGE type electron transport complex subunit D [Bacillota bacterium]
MSEQKTKLIVSHSPHITGKSTTRRIMLDVLIALVPVMAASVLFFGYRSAIHLAVSCAAAFACELSYTMVWKRTFSVGAVKNSSVWDFSCLVTGALVALNVPAGAPYWITAIGSAFAILMVKMLFGGLGKNFANPALTARIFLVVAFTS